MYKKTLLSLAVASTLTLTGCLDDGDNFRSAAPEYNITTSTDGKVYPIFNPVTSALPIPNDLIFDSEQGDGTFGVTPDPTNPAITALNELSGASTIAPIDIAMSGFIDASTVDATEVVMNGSTPAPNPNQTVFVIELGYASGDPVQGLTNSEIPTAWNAVRFGAAAGDPDAIAIYDGGQAQAGADLLALAASPAFEAKVQEFDGTSYIRIHPMKPLDPRKRYVVVVTDGVLDTAGQSIVQSSSYANITDENSALGSSSLEPVRALMNGLWETVADGYFSAVSNTTRPTAPLDTDNIAMSYSFTTSDDNAVSYYIANPAYWISDRLEDSIKVGAAKTALAAGASDFSTIYQAVQTAYITFKAEDINAALAGCDAAYPILDENNADLRIECVGNGLFTSLSGSGVDFPNPEAVTTTFGTPKDALATSALISPLATAGSWPDDFVRVVEGTMTIPYYLGVPNGTDGSPLSTNNWVADDTLATTLNGVFASAGLSIPQADPAVSTAVNYIFPFPKKTADVTIPVLAIFPTNPVGDFTPVIYQHGITTDRSAALAYGSSMVAGAKGSGADIAIIAIDQPLHGVAPVSDATRLELAQTLLTAAGGDVSNAQAAVDGTLATGIVLNIEPTCPGITITDPADEAQVLTAKGQVVQGGVCDGLGFDAVLGAEPSVAVGTAIVLESTVENGGSTIAGLAPTANERHFDFTADASSQPTPMIFDDVNAFGSSGSLFINLSNFLTTRDNLRQQVLDLLTLRLSLDTMDLNGVNGINDANTFFIGHSLGTINGTPFVAVANDTPTGDDNITAANMLTPGGGIIRLIENSPSFAPSILSGLAAAAGLQQGDADLESFFNILQATVDTTDGVNFITSYADEGYKVLLSEVIGDTTIPNSAYPEANFGDASPSPTAGTEPLIELSSAVSTSATAALTQNAVRYTEGFHGTPVYPSSGTTEESAVFKEMVTQSTSIVLSTLLSGGASTSVTVTDTSVIQ